jgi:hypothetical protein
MLSCSATKADCFAFLAPLASAVRPTPTVAIFFVFYRAFFFMRRCMTAAGLHVAWIQCQRLCSALFERGGGGVHTVQLSCPKFNIEPCLLHICLKIKVQYPRPPSPPPLCCYILVSKIWPARGHRKPSGHCTLSYFAVSPPPFNPYLYHEGTNHHEYDNHMVGGAQTVGIFAKSDVNNSRPIFSTLRL